MRIFPLPTNRTEKPLYEDIELPIGRGGTGLRPYAAINMVSSIDGRVAQDGRASGIGSKADRAAMRSLRAKADAVLVGAGTLRAEKLALGLDAPEEGSSALPEDPTRIRQPLAVVLTTRGDVPFENLVRAPGQDLLVFASDAADTEDLASLRVGGAAVTTVPQTTDGLDLAEVARTLSVDHGVRFLLVEGGPTLNHALISAGLVDELFLTLAPKLLGGPHGPHTKTTLLEGAPLAERPPLKLVSVHAAGEELFLRYAF